MTTPNPSGACPITWACMQAYRVPNALIFTLSDVDNEWSEIEELIRSSAPSLGTVHIRAFCALELVYRNVIPTLLFAVGQRDMYGDLAKLRIQRSTEGLAELGDMLRNAWKKTGSMRAALAISRDKSTSAQQQAAMLDKPNRLITACTQSIATLRTALQRDDAQGLQQLGALLGQAMGEATMGPEDAQLRIRQLLEVTQDNPELPWKNK